ncbi:helix-turn-helix transcriptional regulator [Streptomyces sp. CB02923]|uniref:helix-turn-helix transcriptional regulator n=1 Tax=Streptomyces sp. CB02923 TaxID=1718985 RepID=UPI001F5B549E|nr:WYL domain-containing protein [Streptomyces sp. CB02923]
MTTSTTARVLALLEILQGGGIRTVPELAVRLGVDERTVRRYVGHLLDLDIPVDAVRGRHGGYRLAPGYRMPPLMLTDEEALAVLLGLLSGQRGGPGAASAAAGESAAAKVRRVLPVALRRRLEALLETADFTDRPRPATPPEAAALLELAEAVRRRRPVAFAYTDRKGSDSARTVLPYGLVGHSGRWYLTGARRDDGEMRIFRLDRMASVRPLSGSFDVPDGFDPAATVLDHLARTPWTHDVSLRVRGSVEHLRGHLPAGIAALSEDGPDWVHVRIRAERLDWIPPVLAALDRPFVIERPAELRGLVQALSRRLDAYAAGSPAEPSAADEQPS